MSTYDVISNATKDILFQHGVNSGDFFRQWLYTKDYGYNPEVDKLIHNGIIKGKSANEIAQSIITTIEKRTAPICKDKKCEIQQVHDDGDLTVKAGDETFLLTTEGRIFKEVKQEPVR